MNGRRGAGEGSVYRRRDGRWQASLTVGYESGRQRRRDFYGKTRRDVQERLDAARRDLAAGIAPTGERLTVAVFLERWIEEVRPALAPRTHERYAELLRLHVIPTLGQTRLSKLGAQDVQALLSRKIAAGLSPTTVLHIRAVLRRALRDALRYGLVSRNVATLVDPPRVRRQEIAALTPEAARAVLDAVGNERLGPLVTVALATGLRQGEVLGLRWSDVNLDEATLTVRQTISRMRGKLVFATPKTARSHRTVTLPGIAVVALRAQRAQQNEARLRVGSAWRDHNLVFTTSVGTPLDGTSVTHDFQTLIEAAGLPRMRFHDLRHGYATMMLAQGVAPRVVMEQLGHSTIAMTLNVYSHVIPALQREAAERLDDLLTGS